MLTILSKVNMRPIYGIDGNGYIWTPVKNKRIRVSDIKKGDRVLSDRDDAVVKQVIKIPVNDRIDLFEYGGIKMLPRQEAKFILGMEELPFVTFNETKKYKWFTPINFLEGNMTFCDDIYNIVLSSGNVLFVNEFVIKVYDEKAYNE